MFPKKRYFQLLEISTIERKDELQSITMEEGFNIDLIIPSNEHYIPKEYLIYVKANYENGNISYEEMEQILMFVGLTPEKLGY